MIIESILGPISLSYILMPVFFSLLKLKEATFRFITTNRNTPGVLRSKL